MTWFLLLYLDLPFEGCRKYQHFTNLPNYTKGKQSIFQKTPFGELLSEHYNSHIFQRNPSISIKRKLIKKIIISCFYLDQSSWIKNAINQACGSCPKVWIDVLWPTDVTCDVFLHLGSEHLIAMVLSFYCWFFMKSFWNLGTFVYWRLVASFKKPETRKHKFFIYWQKGLLQSLENIEIILMGEKS